MFKQWIAMGENKRAVEWAVAVARNFSGGPFAAMDDRKSRCRQNSDELSRNQYPVHTLTIFHGNMVLYRLMSAAVRTPCLRANREVFCRICIYSFR